MLLRQRGLHHIDLGDQPLGNVAHVACDWRVGIHRPFLRQDLLVGLQPQRSLLARVQAAVDHHLLAGIGIDRAVREPVEHRVAGGQQQHPPADVAEQATPLRALGRAGKGIVAHLCADASSG
ncbi:hypothetical protein G6F35_018043 [Rhizopus arrhizus]|nr:hypothetical protein G6F35_018043 [Rhizopus arrhizus]